MAKTDYYSEKRNFYRKVETILKTNAQTELSFLIKEAAINFGFGVKTVTDFLKILQNTGDISIIDGIITWKKPKKHGKNQ